MTRFAVPAVIVVSAVAQALLVGGHPDVDASPAFIALAAASVAVLLVGAWLVAGLAFAIAAGTTGGAFVRTLRTPRILVWVAGILAVAALAAVFVIWLAPVVLLLGALVLPAVVESPANPVGRTLRSIRRHPVRKLLFVLGFALIVVLTWVAVLVSGFFLTGPLSAFLAWLWFGGVAVLELWASSRLHLRGEKQ